MQAFSLDPESGIPVKLQLKAHVKYQITSGILRPGDQLPSLRDLSAGLGINLNTVVRAFGELEAEGYLYRHQGKGVFVADDFPGQGHGAALRSLLAGVAQTAREWQMTPDEMAFALLAHSQLAAPPRTASSRLLLVSGSRLQLRRLQGELEALLPVVVETALVEEVPDKLRQADFRGVAVTLFHAAEVRSLLPSGTVVTLAGSGPQQTLATLQQLPSGTTVAVAARDWLHAARVRRSLELSGLGHLRLETVAGQTPEAFAPALQEAAAVLCTPDSRELLRDTLGGKTMLAEPVDLPAEAVVTIRRALGVPGTEQRVHVRSAWV